MGAFKTPKTTSIKTINLRELTGTGRRVLEGLRGSRFPVRTVGSLERMSSVGSGDSARLPVETAIRPPIARSKFLEICGEIGTPPLMSFLRWKQLSGKAKAYLKNLFSHPAEGTNVVSESGVETGEATGPAGSDQLKRMVENWVSDALEYKTPSNIHNLLLPNGMRFEIEPSVDSSGDPRLLIDLGEATPEQIIDQVGTYLRLADPDIDELMPPWEVAVRLPIVRHRDIARYELEQLHVSVEKAQAIIEEMKTFRSDDTERAQADLQRLGDQVGGWKETIRRRARVWRFVNLYHTKSTIDDNLSLFTFTTVYDNIVQPLLGVRLILDLNMRKLKSKGTGEAIKELGERGSILSIDRMIQMGSALAHPEIRGGGATEHFYGRQSQIRFSYTGPLIDTRLPFSDPGRQFKAVEIMTALFNGSVDRIDPSRDASERLVETESEVLPDSSIMVAVRDNGKVVEDRSHLPDLSTAVDTLREFNWGHLWLKSEPGVGSEFRFVIPARNLVRTDTDDADMTALPPTKTVVEEGTSLSIEQRLREEGFVPLQE